MLYCSQQRKKHLPQVLGSNGQWPMRGSKWAGLRSIRTHFVALGLVQLKIGFLKFLWQLRNYFHLLFTVYPFCTVLKPRCRGIWSCSLMTALSSLRLPISPFLLPKHGLYHLLSRTSSSLFLSPKPRFWTVQCSSSLASTSDSTSLPTDTSEEGLKWESFRKKKVVMRIGYVGTDYRGKNDYVFLPLLSRSHSSAVLCYCPNYLLFQNIRFISHSLSLQGFKCNATSMNYQVSTILTN